MFFGKFRRVEGIVWVLVGGWYGVEVNVWAVMGEGFRGRFRRDEVK